MRVTGTVDKGIWAPGSKSEQVAVILTSDTDGVRWKLRAATGPVMGPNPVLDAYVGSRVEVLGAEIAGHVLRILEVKVLP